MVPQIKKKRYQQCDSGVWICPRFFYVNEGDEKSLESI